MDVLKFGLELDDLFTPTAARAEASVRKLEGELKRAKADLGGFQSQLRLANSLGDVAGHGKYSALVQDARARVFGLGEGVGAAKEELRGLGTAASGAGSALGILGPAAAAVAAAFVAMAADIAVSALKTGLAVTEVNAKLEATFDALGAQGEHSGKTTLAFLDDLSAKLPETRDELAKWTKQYEAMGTTNLDELRHQILATASAQAIMGDEGADAYKRIAERVNLAVEAHHGLKLAEKSLKSLYEAGVNETDVARAMGVSVEQLSAGLKAGTVDAQAFGNALSSTLIEKGKGPLQVMGSELGTIEAKALETWHHFFDGLDASPITDALKTIVQLGDQGEVSGQVLGEGIKSGTQILINALGEGITEATVFFLELETGYVKTMTYLDPIIAAFERFGIVSGDASANVRAFTDGFTGAAQAAEILTRVAVGDIGGAGRQAAGMMAPANASGGVVQPARGEMLASVAPGEMILPAPAAGRMQASGGAAVAPANDNAGPGGGVYVDHLEVNVHAAAGVTDAHQLSVTGLSVALERLQLASGR